MSNRQNAFEFFFANAGYNYNPITQSEFAGRVACAIELATAEAKADIGPHWFSWFDDNELADYQDERGAWLQAPAVSCAMMRRQDGLVHVVASLGGIMESDNPAERANYRRVIEAELTLEGIDR